VKDGKHQTEMNILHNNVLSATLQFAYLDCCMCITSFWITTPLHTIIITL